MHWRTEHLIQGTAGARFTVPMNRRGSTLEATLFLAGKPQPGRLNLTRH
jgi:hypothetical protein